MDNLGIAESVVIRHPEYKFTVDGEDFPWYITERGPVVTRLANDIYTVDVEIMGIAKHVNDDGYHEMLGMQVETRTNCPAFIPVIGGRKFPWACTDDVMTLQFSHKMIATLHLKFFARHVDAQGIKIKDERATSAGKKLFRAGGDMIHAGDPVCSTS